MKKFKRIYIEITNACNLDCSICPGTKRPKTFISPQSFELILKKIKPFTDHIYLHVLGEPLLHPDFPEILSLCEKNALKVNISTNGVLIKKHENILLTSKAIRQINFSIHCLEIQQNSAIPDAYLDNILSFIEKGRGDRPIFFSIRIWNFKDKNNLNLELTKKLENSFSTPFKINDLIHDKHKITLAPNVFLDIAKTFIWPEIREEKIHDDGRAFCRGLRDHCAILVDGSVVPCCLDKDAVIRLGNIFNSQLDIILNSERAKKIVEEFGKGKAEEKLCKSCEFRKRF